MGMHTHVCVRVRVCVIERRIYLLCGSTKSTIIFKPLRSIRMLILFSLSLSVCLLLLLLLEEAVWHCYCPVVIVVVVVGRYKNTT